MRYLKIFGTAVIVLLVVAYGIWRLSSARAFQFFGEIVPRAEIAEPAVALTFDDGPTPEATNEILAMLKERGVRATFFVTGAELEQNPEAGQRIVADGHELGNHSYSHQRMIFKSPAFIRDEIERTDQLIRRAGYQGPIHFRSPYGKKLVLLPYYLSRTHRKNIFWDVEPDSYPEIAADADKITRHVLDQVRPGSIILLHIMYPSRAPSLRAVPGIIDGLGQRGYQFKIVSELLAMK